MSEPMLAGRRRWFMLLLLLPPMVVNSTVTTTKRVACRVTRLWLASIIILASTLGSAERMRVPWPAARMTISSDMGESLTY